MALGLVDRRRRQLQFPGNPPPSAATESLEPSPQQSLPRWMIRQRQTPASDSVLRVGDKIVTVVVLISATAADYALNLTHS